MSNIQNQYIPDQVSPPGDTLAEALEETGMTQVEFAQRIGMSRKHLKQILDGVASITPETALKFERVLGTSARFWNNREQQYRDFLARQEENAELARQIDWLKHFKHLGKMAKMGWLPDARHPVDKLRNLLEFFSVTSPAAWKAHYDALQVRYRCSQVKEPDPYALAAWLRRGEIMGHDRECKPYDVSAFRKALRQARALTKQPPEVFQKALVDICADCGVVVVFVPELPKTASGATRWLSPDKALIQLSLRYKTDDHLWFTFFHEAGHILLHSKKEIFIEGFSDNSTEEEAANAFAANMLIPAAVLNAFAARHPSMSKQDIEHFAREQGIAPGIVVGRLQHEKLLPFSHFNFLKRTFKWSNASS